MGAPFSRRCSRRIKTQVLPVRHSSAAIMFFVSLSAWESIMRLTCSVVRRLVAPRSSLAACKPWLALSPPLTACALSLAALEEQDGNLAEVHVEEVLRLVRHKGAEVAAHNAVPRGAELLVELATRWQETQHRRVSDSSKQPPTRVLVPPAPPS